MIIIARKSQTVKRITAITRTTPFEKFGSSLFKGSQGLGAAPRVAPAGAKHPKTAFNFAQRNKFFFAAACSKRTERVCSHNIPTAPVKYSRCARHRGQSRSIMSCGHDTGDSPRYHGLRFCATPLRKTSTFRMTLVGKDGRGIRECPLRMTLGVKGETFVNAPYG